MSGGRENMHNPTHVPSQFVDARCEESIHCLLMLKGNRLDCCVILIHVLFGVSRIDLLHSHINNS